MAALRGIPNVTSERQSEAPVLPPRIPFAECQSLPKLCRMSKKRAMNATGVLSL